MAMPGLRLAIGATAVYTVLIAIATVIVFRIFPPPTGLAGILAALLPFQLAAVLWCFFIVTRTTSWSRIGFGRLRWSGLIWFLPSWVVLAVMIWTVSQSFALADLLALGLTGLALLIVTTFLIGFGEEVMFRGILLHGAATSASLLSALLISAGLFGVFHFVNALAGQGMSVTTRQVAFAALVGFSLAPIALRIGNLWPLIIWHWLWNIVVFLSQVGDILHPLALTGIVMQAVISIWLWADLIRHPNVVHHEIS